MKSKSYILMQIKNILMTIKSYTNDEADTYVEGVQEKTVYELLVLKKELSESDEEYLDISCRRSIWHEEY
jgi:hypothetical protein|tara:strand:- start:355 stop:564 length:210 start_codon:yes stop_codon:yes gene_type:complete